MASLFRGESTPYNETIYERNVMPTLNLLAEVLVAEDDLNEAQRMIDHARKTYIGNLPFVRSALDRRQVKVDVQRIKIEAAKTYLTAIE
jgi:hypothetical protein